MMRIITFENDIDRKACPMPCSLGQGMPLEKKAWRMLGVKINAFFRCSYERRQTVSS
jgi:hypothetical protein